MRLAPKQKGQDWVRTLCFPAFLIPEPPVIFEQMGMPIRQPGLGVVVPDENGCVGNKEGRKAGKRERRRQSC